MIGWLTARLQRRLSIALALVIVPPTLIIAFYAVTQTGRVLIDAARMERLRLVTARTAVAERMLSDTAADVLFLSQAPAVRRFVNAASGAARAQALAEIERHFVAFLGRWTSRYADMCLLDERGRETLCVRVTDGRPAVVPANGLADRAAESYFTGALSLLAIPGQLPVHVAELELQPAGRAFAQPLVPTLRYTTPLQTDAGLLAGALALNALVGRVLQAVETGDPPQEGAATYVVDRSGYYIAHPRPERRFGNLLGSGYTLHADRPNDAAVLLGGRAGTLLQSADRPDALQAYAHIRPSGQSRVVWTVIEEVSLDSILGEVRRTRAVIIVVAVLALLLAAGVALLATHNIVRPLRALAKTADAISQGQLDIHLPVEEGNDEIGVLTQAFGRMTARLKAVVGALEQRVHDLEAAQTALRASETRLRRMIEANLVGITFADVDGNVVEANDAFLRIVGYGRADLEAGHIHRERITAPEYRDVTARAIADLKTHGACAPYEKEYVRKDGGRVPVLVGAALIEGSSEQVVAFVLDQTERKQAEADRHARYAAEAANRAKNEFLARMSHELRTPLNAVLGYAQILQWEKDLSERQRNGLEAIQKSGEHLLQLIVDLLDLSRIETGRFRLEPAPLDLDGFLEGVGDIIRVKAHSHTLTFRATRSGSLPMTVLADHVRLRQVLLNLLDNAVKYTDRGEVHLHVRADPAAAGTVTLRFEVSDTGIGIAPADLQRVFLPFEQVGTVKRSVGGSGLGLAISRQIVRLMGGELAAESHLGRGSRFYFALQFPVLSEPAAATVTPALPVSYRGARRKVLVVDDVLANRALLCEVLQQRGFLVCEADDGEQALQRAASEHPDLILMDIAMPVMNGLEATRRLRATAALQDIPVVCISAAASEGDRQSSLAAGANDFIVKPVDLTQLLWRIGALLGLQWVDQE